MSKQTHQPAQGRQGFVNFIIPALLVVLAAAAGYLVYKNKKAAMPAPQNQEQIQMLDAKQYINSKYSFEFSYPTQLVFQGSHQKSGDSSLTTQSLESADTLLLTTGRNCVKDVCDSANFSLIIIPDYSIQAPEDFSKGTNSPPATVTLGNNSLTAVIQQIGDNSLGARYYLSSDISGHFFLFQLDIENTSNIEKNMGSNYLSLVQGRRLAEQIISTFKFTQLQASQVDTSAWKTYTNSTLGISFKYPPSLGQPDGAFTPGETGKMFRMVFSGNREALELGADSVDYTAGRSGDVLDIKSSYTENDVAKSEAPVTQIDAQNVKVYLMAGIPQTGPSSYPLPGNYAAVVNLSSTTYPALVFSMQSDKLSLDEFKAILKTIQIK